MKKTVILETFPFEPHLEISGEVALNFKKKQKEKVYFGWLGSDLKWAEWHLPIYKKFYSSYDLRLKKFHQILKQKGIEIIKSSKYSLDKKKILKWSKNFEGDIYDLKNYKFQGKELGLGVASSLISFVHESKPDLQNLKDIVQKSLYTSATIYLLSKKILKMYNPDRLVTFNGRFATSRAIAIAAKDLKIKTIFHERGSSLNKYELFEENLHKSEYRKKLIDIHWKNNSKNKNRNKIGRNFFIRTREGKRINFSGLKFKKNNIDPIINKKRKEKIYSYFASTSYEWDAILGFKKNNWKNEFDALSNLINAVKNYRKDIKLVIRMHPLNKLLKSNKDIENIREIAKKNKILLFDEKSNIDSYKLIKKSYAVVTYGSTIGAEAIFWGKPSISMRSCFYSKKNTIYSALNNTELKKVLLKKKLNKKKNSSVLPYAFYQMTFGKEFKYFKPINFHSGYFCGEKLSILRPYMSFLVSRIKIFLKN